MFNEEDGVARFYHGVEEVEDALDVVEVQAIGRLVHDEDFARIAKVGSQFDALQLAARERRKRLIQMEIAQTDLAQWFQLLSNDGTCKHFRGFVGGHVHHLGDIHAVDFVSQYLIAVSQSATGLTGSLDGIHKGHIADDDTFALADGTATLAVEGEEVSLGFVGLSEKFADVVGNFQIGGRGGAQTDADVLLADVNDFLGMGIGLAETLHQRAFTRASHACNAAHYA